MNSDTLLFRQINPQFRREDQVHYLAFDPFGNQAGQLSCYNGDLVTAAEAFAHYVEELGRASIGVMAVSLSECEAVGCLAVHDGVPYEAHAFIDFTNLRRTEQKARALVLAEYANARSWMYGPVHTARPPS